MQGLCKKHLQGSKENFVGGAITAKDVGFDPGLRLHRKSRITCSHVPSPVCRFKHR